MSKLSSIFHSFVSHFLSFSLSLVFRRKLFIFMQLMQTLNPCIMKWNNKFHIPSLMFHIWITVSAITLTIFAKYLFHFWMFCCFVYGVLSVNLHENYMRDKMVHSYGLIERMAIVYSRNNCIAESRIHFYFTACITHSNSYEHLNLEPSEIQYAQRPRVSILL